MNLKLAIITASIYLSLATIIFIINKSNTKTLVTASVSPKIAYIGNHISYKDSTADSHSVLWEFGNGDKSIKKVGTYNYKKEGKYLVRVTIDRKIRDTFSVIIKPDSSVKKLHIARSILAGKTGIIGQKIHFKMMGPKVSWCEWYFGCSGKIDSRETETFYAYPNTGEYEVKLLTNLNPNVPLKHRVTIINPYKSVENIPDKKPEEKPAVDKLLIKIQAIANGGNVSNIYNLIIKEYLCSNPHIKVSVNNKVPIDFYSYCQSLQLGSKIKIIQVTPESDIKTGCISKLTIQQQ